MAHITGGRNHRKPAPILPNTTAQIEIGSWRHADLRASGDLGQVCREMMRTFNMGIGLIAAIPGGQIRAPQKTC